MACGRSKLRWRPKILFEKASHAARTQQQDESNWPEDFMTQTIAPATYKSPLHEMTQTTPTCLWNDSASIQELTYSIEHGTVGATRAPVIVHAVLKKEMPAGKDRIRVRVEERPTATEDEIGWQLVREVSMKSAALLKPIFDSQGGRNGRLSIQTDPRLYATSADI